MKRYGYRPHKKKSRLPFTVPKYVGTVCLAVILALIAGAFVSGMFNKTAAKDDDTQSGADTSDGAQGGDSGETQGDDKSEGFGGLIISLADISDVAKIKEEMENTGADAVIIDFKNDAGKFNFPAPKAGKIVSGGLAADALSVDNIEPLQQAGIKVGARISCFKDDFAAESKLGAQLKEKNGEIWSDAAKKYWLNPYLEETKNYLSAVIEDAVSAGFDFIVFDNISFPQSGKTENIDFGEDAPDKSAEILSCVTAFCEVIGGRAGAYLILPEISFTEPEKAAEIGQRTDFSDYPCPVLRINRNIAAEYILGE